MCHCSNLYHVYNNTYKSNYSFFILICLQPFCKPHLYFILLHGYLLFCSQPFCKQYTYSLDLPSGDLQTHNFTQDWLNYNWLLSALSGRFIYVCLQSAERSQSRGCIILPSIELCSVSAFSYLSVPHACCWRFIWKV